MDNAPTVVAKPSDPSNLEIANLEHVKEQFKKLQQFVASQMVKDRDFGIIPGCKKPSLWKPGAEKLLNLHGLACRLTSTKDTVLDWKGGFFNYAYSAEVYNPRTGNIVAVSEGSCNNKEKKYADRDGADLVNTIQKMAQKRAMVGATLMACRASDIFTPGDDDDEDKSAGASGAASKPDASGYVAKDAISEPRRKRLYALLKESGKEEDELLVYLQEKYPYTVDEQGAVHPSRLSWKHYDAVCEWVLPGSSKK